MTTARHVQVAQQRTMSLLMLSQTLGSIAVTITFAVSGILAAEMAGSTSAAGLTQATLTLGAGAAAYLLGTWMNKKGRRTGMATGYLIGALGAAACVTAAETSIFPLLVAGTAALGASVASTGATRFAATDLATSDRRATALSTVVWVATIGAVLGPLMVGPAADFAVAMGLPPLAGAFVFDGTCAAIAGLLIFVRMRPDPLLLARQTGNVANRTTESPAEQRTSFTGLVPAITALVLSHATMTAVMVMTPLEMHDHGASHAAIGTAVSIHFLGMYALSPLSGLLADRVGVRAGLLAGGAMQMTAVVVLTGLLGESAITHALGLFLVGFGWSLCTVAASAHIASASKGNTRIQGAADTAMTVASAAAALVAGPLMAIWGFGGLLALAALFTLGGLAVVPRVQARSADPESASVEPWPGRAGSTGQSRACAGDENVRV